MKLYEQPRAPNPRRVRIFLAEKGIEVASEVVSINDKAHLTEAFRALNPTQRVPVLELDDGTAISESVAICRYFEEIQPEPALMGASPLEKAQIEMWNRRLEMGLLANVAGCFRHHHPAMAELEVPQISAWGDVCRERALEALKILDDALSDSRYVAGGTFTIADITALCAVDFMRPAKITLPDDLKAVARWHEEVSARPSAKA